MPTEDPDTNPKSDSDNVELTEIVSAVVEDSKDEDGQLVPEEVLNGINDILNGETASKQDVREVLKYDPDVETETNTSDEDSE